MAWDNKSEDGRLRGRPWRRLVDAVKVRDNCTCRMCGRITDEGDCDHIVPIHKGGKDEMANLQWLCRTPCHAEKTERESAEAQGRKISVKINEDGWPIGR